VIKLKFTIELYQAYRSTLISEAEYHYRLDHNGNNLNEPIEIDYPIKAYGMDIILATPVFRKVGRSIGTGAMQTIAHTLCAIPLKVSILPDDENAVVSMTNESDITNIYPTVQLDKKYTYIVEI
jgi:hypothetical protein